jgi:uncharacterized protein (TIGR03118 family)
MKPRAIAPLLALALAHLPGAATAAGFDQVNLVSDLSGQAQYVDSHLVNPWGLVPGGTGVFWVSNNGTGTSTLYDPNGVMHPLVVTIPGGAPTGIVVTSPADSAFVAMKGDSAGRAVFIYATEHGTIDAWSPVFDPTMALQMATVQGAEYKGLALGGMSPGAPQLYAANFTQMRIDVFDRHFVPVTLGSGAFTDPNLPAGFGPFNVANLGGQLFVAYAEVDTSSGDEVKGAGLGYVDVYDMNGTLLRRFASSGTLNAPWGLAWAPASFGGFGGSVLVGNFGDGTIHAYALGNGSLQGALADTLGHPIMIDGLWGISFGAPAAGATVAHRLYFAAGLQDEAHGLFGYLAVDTISTRGGGGGPGACANNSMGIGWWRKQCGGPSHGHGNGRGRSEAAGFGHGHGPGPGSPNDSLATWLACISSGPAPNAFGTEGCFTAGCELLDMTGDRSTMQKAAQQLLTLRLNLCSGRVCEGFVITCREGDDDDGGRAVTRTWTLGELADSLDVLLCGGGSRSELHALTSLLSCVNEGDEHGDDDEGDDDDRGRDAAQQVTVQAIGVSPAHLTGEPVRFSVTTSQPTFVRLRIFDAAGRMVAEPMPYAQVSGSQLVTWDRRDSNGRMVSPGNYFYRAIAGSKASSGRIVILR